MNFKRLAIQKKSVDDGWQNEYSLLRGRTNFNEHNDDDDDMKWIQDDGAAV